MLVASITRLLAALAAACPEPRVWPAPASVHHGRAPHMCWAPRPHTRMRSVLGMRYPCLGMRLSRRWSCSPIRARARADRCGRNTKRVHHAVGGDVTVVRPILPGGPLPVAKNSRGQGGTEENFQVPESRPRRRSNWSFLQGLPGFARHFNRLCRSNGHFRRARADARVAMRGLWVSSGGRDRTGRGQPL
jgi:hypothetical protein